LPSTLKGEHEASRRMKTELLIQMDGLAHSKELVFVLTATNLPWELDQAMLRRLEKRILVGLPCPKARRAMLAALLADRMAAPASLDAFADGMEGYSGSDLTLVAKEAAMRPLRRLMDMLEGKEGDQTGAAVIGAVEEADLRAAVAAVKPTAQQYKCEYDRFTQQRASHLSCF